MYLNIHKLFKQTPLASVLRGSRARPADGPERERRIKALCPRELPPFPGPTTIPELVIGTPALLQPEQDELSRVRMLAAAYRAACLDRFGVKSNFLLFGHIAAHKLYPTLVDAAARLWELEIPPVAWSLFSSDVWVSHVRSCQADSVRRVEKHRPPTARWVWSAKRLEGRIEWFEDVRESYILRRTRVAPRHAALIQAWRAMWSSLLAADPRTREGVLHIVGEHFPGDLWETEVIGSKVEVARMQRDIDEQIALGGNLWA